jgi:hypothetical protein
MYVLAAGFATGEKKDEQLFVFFLDAGGADGARTRDPRRDRPVF